MNNLGFSRCMIDSDANAIGRRRRLRGEALAASLVVEAAAVTTMLLWPLLTPGVLRPQIILTPLPPFHGAPDSSRVHPHPAATTRLHATDILYQPPRIPERIATATREPPAISADSLVETVPGVDGSIGNGPAPEILLPKPVPHPSAAFRRSTEVMEALLVHRVQPDYPLMARKMGLSGTVKLQAVIGRDGTVHRIELLEGNPILAKSAEAAVKEWRFEPTRLGGTAVEVQTIITVNFVLER